MKKLLTPIALLIAGAAGAQFQMNPQLGINFTDLTNEEPGVEYKADIGFQAGIDFRIGDRFYLQPGMHLIRTSTQVKYTYSDTFVSEYDLVRTGVKAKLLVSYNLIHGDAFKLRLNGGPTYDVLLSVDHTGDPVAWNSDDYSKGSFNMDAGLGMDIWLVSLEGGLSYGLSNSYKDTYQLSNDPKYFTWYFTLGIVLGSSGG